MDLPQAWVDLVGLSKIFERHAAHPALDGVDLAVRPGSVIGLMGANGCGKSTLLRHMVGLLLPTAGTVRTLGCPAAELDAARLARIGYVDQETRLLEWLSVERHIELVAAFYERWNERLCREIMARFDLDGRARVGSLSSGKRQQLAALLGVCHEPDLILLDEPAAALDTRARAEFLDILMGLIAEGPGRTIVISSHILSDIEKIIDHAVVMDRGRIVCDEGLDDLRERMWRVRLTNLPAERPLPFEPPHVVKCRREGDEALCVLAGLSRGELLKRADRAGVACAVEPLTLEEIYLAVLDAARSGAPA